MYPAFDYDEKMRKSWVYDKESGRVRERDMQNNNEKLWYYKDAERNEQLMTSATSTT